MRNIKHKLCLLVSVNLNYSTGIYTMRKKKNVDAELTHEDNQHQASSHDEAEY